MNPLYAVILGIVEGMTEYLPVSSTGHLILVSRLLGLDGAGPDAFAVVIQFGAILAVVVQYRKLLWERTAGLVKGERASFSLLAALVLGFAPTAVVGLLLRKRIKEVLFGAQPVAIALVVGGIVMIVIEALRAKKARGGVAGTQLGLDGLEHVTP